MSNIPANNNDKEDLQKRIEAAKTARDKGSAKASKDSGGQNQSSNDAMGNGMRAGLELVVSIGAGTFIGYWLDKTFDTKPLFLIALFFLGVITGFVNVWRVTNNVGYAVGYKNMIDEEKSHKHTTQHEDEDEKTN
jgi:ATP synthase protein I